MDIKTGFREELNDVTLKALSYTYNIDLVAIPGGLQQKSKGLHLSRLLLLSSRK